MTDAGAKINLKSTLTLDPDALAEIGRALWGSRWQTEMTQALGLGDSARIRQWLSGYRPIPAGIPAELATLCRERAAQLERLARRLTTGASIRDA